MCAGAAGDAGGVAGGAGEGERDERGERRRPPAATGAAAPPTAGSRAGGCAGPRGGRAAPRARAGGAGDRGSAGWPSWRRCPDVRVGGGAPTSHIRPENQPPPMAPGGQCTRRSNVMREREQRTHGVAQPSVPSERTRRTVTSGPSLRRTQVTMARLGTPCRRAAAVQVARSL